MKMYKYIILIMIACVFYMCDDFFEKDISKSVITLLSPADSLVTDDFEHTFWWDPVDDATGYQLQIVSPSFDYIKDLVVDTNLSAEQFIYTLYPDTFEWVVRAYNGSSSTEFSSRILIIDSSNVISDISLISPLPNYITNDSIISFRWKDHIFAEYYSIEILFDEEVFAVETVSDNVTYTLPNTQYTELLEGNFRWRVLGFNSISNGSSEYRNFMIDWTAPGKPVLLSPTNNDTISDVELSWKHPLLGGSPIFDSVFIFKDTTTSIPDTYFITDTTFSSDFENGVYYWKIKSVDQAGNEGSVSAIRKFVVRNEK